MTSKNEPVIPIFHPALVGKRAMQLHDSQLEEQAKGLHGLVVGKVDDHNRITRESCILTIRGEGGSWTVTIISPTDGMQASHEVTSLMTAIEELAIAFDGDRLSWKPTKDFRGKARRALDRALE